MKKVLFIILATIGLVPNIVKGQIINTVAGNGTIVWAGDTGQATAAPVAGPFGIAFDPADNMYIADFGLSMVHKVNTAGIISQFAGYGSGAYCGDGGPAPAACVSKPHGVACDAFGNVYIADHDNEVVRKVNSAGIITTVAGDGTHAYSGDGGLATNAQLIHPNGVACDAAGNVYITSSNSVRKVNISSGIITTIAGDSMPGYTGDGGLATAARLNHPQGLTVDASGNIFVTDSWNNVIRKINTSGIITTIAGNGFGAGTGSGGFSGDGGTALTAKLNIPIGGVAFGAIGNMFIADNGNNRIRMVNTAGIISTVVGNGLGGFSGDGGLATAAELYNPMGVAFDASGNLCIADANNYRIRRVDKTLSIFESSNLNTQISVYPNPAANTISLATCQIPHLKNAVITVQNTLGQTVKKTAFATSVDISEIQNGCYFVQIILSEGTTYKARFIKE